MQEVNEFRGKSEMVMKVVLDTNVILDWLHFADTDSDALAMAIASRKIEVFTSESCLEELKQVIAKSELGLSGHVQDRLLQNYQAHARISKTMKVLTKWLPRCSDPDDQKFIELAWQCEAQFLLSRDKAVLRLSRKILEFGIQVLTPFDFTKMLNFHGCDGQYPFQRMLD